jgi:hypothetical protein
VTCIAYNCITYDRSNDLAMPPRTARVHSQRRGLVVRARGRLVIVTEYAFFFLDLHSKHSQIFTLVLLLRLLTLAHAQVPSGERDHGQSRLRDALQASRGFGMHTDLSVAAGERLLTFRVVRVLADGERVLLQPVMDRNNMPIDLARPVPFLEVRICARSCTHTPIDVVRRVSLGATQTLVVMMMLNVAVISWFRVCLCAGELCLRLKARRLR